MSIIYVEQYEITGRVLGIEELMPESDKRIDGIRYQLWVGGCGVGRAKTIEEARGALVRYMVGYLGILIEDHEERLAKARQARIILQIGQAGIEYFEVAP